MRMRMRTKSDQVQHEWLCNLFKSADAKIFYRVIHKKYVIIHCEFIFILASEIGLLRTEQNCPAHINVVHSWTHSVRSKRSSSWSDRIWWISFDALLSVFLCIGKSRKCICIGLLLISIMIPFVHIAFPDWKKKHNKIQIILLYAFSLASAIQLYTIILANKQKIFVLLFVIEAIHCIDVEVQEFFWMAISMKTIIIDRM